MTYTITKDDDDIHIRAIVRGAAEIEELIDKLNAYKEQTYGRHDSVSLDVPAESVSRSSIAADDGGYAGGIKPRV